MPKILNVYFHGKIIGQIEQDKQGDMSFTYSGDWLRDPNAIRISCSLPLQEHTFVRKNCAAFFGGILPEENQRRLIAKNLGISANNDFSMLEKIGGECAGALSFISVGENLVEQGEKYHELTDSQLANLLRELPARPLLAGEIGIRLSLAGVQDKLAVYVENERIFIPLYNAPSTHILKLNFNRYDNVIFNEVFCLKLAKLVGLSVIEAHIKKIENIHYLLIKRYDREYLNPLNNTKAIMRLHQEDFCQALGIPSKNKYQNEGGPSLKQCFDLIRMETSKPVISLGMLMDAVIFNYLIGNCDAHGKNFSLLYFENLALAPLYDLICTTYYKNISQKMAMKIGGEYQINKISIENFYQLADEIGFSKPEIRKRIVELSEAIIASLSMIEVCHPIQEELVHIIKLRCENFILNIKAGSRGSKPIAI